MNDPIMILRGPDARALWALCPDPVRLTSGEGGWTAAGRVGELWGTFTDSGTSLSLLSPSDIDEDLARGATTLRLFASRQELESASPAATEHQLSAPAGGGDFDMEAAPVVAPDWSLSLKLRTPSTGLVNTVRIRDSGSAIVALQESVDECGDRAEFRHARNITASELDRLRTELRLLDTGSWRDYGAAAYDGLLWSLQISGRTPSQRASGSHAFPPDGTADEDESRAFSRMLLAVSRATGLPIELGDTVGALKAIPDPVARTEHAILAALRTWVAYAIKTELQPHTITEPAFQPGFMTHGLEPLALGARQNVTLKATSAQPEPVLAGWPNVGPVDVEIPHDESGVAWLELKWAKDAGTLHNCAFDAAKLAQAIRDGPAEVGYLVAGAPVREWAKPGPHRRLFEPSVFSDGTVVSDFSSSWNTWIKEDGATRGLQHIPDPILTVPIGRAFVPNPDGEWWAIRVARVTAPGTATFDLPR